jgi:hypothetical protein
MLGVAAAVEAVTGLLLRALPHLMAKLLFGTEVIGAGISLVEWLALPSSPSALVAG